MTMLLMVLDRFGFLGGAAMLAVSGLTEAAPDLLIRFGIAIPEHLSHGLGRVALATLLLAFGRNAARSEAEKRIDNPALSNRSVVPAIQKQIEQQQAATASGAAERHET